MIVKYPRTQHVRGSHLQYGDEDLDAVSFDDLRGKHLVVEEKIDGTNSGISFESGRLMLQSRDHYLRGGPREKQFDLLKQWSSMWRQDLNDILDERYVMYGEWMFAKHTCFYDMLPHYFMEFDVWDKERGFFLDTSSRYALLRSRNHGVNIEPVLVVAEGMFGSLDALKELVCDSHFKSRQWRADLTRQALLADVDPDVAKFHTDMSDLMEGLYVKWEEDGIVKGRYKFVRESFTNHVLSQDQHWHDRPIIQNSLRPGAFNAMFGTM